ncbi:MAG: hypothetical protein V3S68_09565 [Dehalococcoidia bacterium]
MTTGLNFSVEDKPETDDLPTPAKVVAQTETTSPVIDMDSVDILEQLLEADAAPEPAALNTKDVIQRPDADGDIASAVSEMASAGHRYVYHVVTGEQSVINNNMLAIQLSKKLPDGRRAFTTRAPLQTPYRGTVRCRLHPSDPQRDEFARMGWSECPADHMPSLLQLQLHMKSKHRVELATLEAQKVEDRDNRMETDRQEDRLYQRAQTDTMMEVLKLAGGAQNVPAVTDDEIAKLTTPVAEGGAEPGSVEFEATLAMIDGDGERATETNAPAVTVVETVKLMPDVAPVANKTGKRFTVACPGLDGECGAAPYAGTASKAKKSFKKHWDEVHAG